LTLNLRSAARVIQAVNPDRLVDLGISSGYTESTDGTRVPYYTWAEDVSAQIQALDNKELQHLQMLNIGGILKKIYVFGVIESLDRKWGKGGDLVRFEGDDWLVVHVNESWNGIWTAATIQKQVT
jgi:hypothetical protein